MRRAQGLMKKEVGDQESQGGSCKQHWNSHFHLGVGINKLWEALTAIKEHMKITKTKNTTGTSLKNDQKSDDIRSFSNTIWITSEAIGQIREFRTTSIPHFSIAILDGPSTLLPSRLLRPWPCQDYWVQSAGLEHVSEERSWFNLLWASFITSHVERVTAR